MAVVSLARGNTWVCSFLPFHISTLDMMGEAVGASAVAAASVATRLLLGWPEEPRGAAAAADTTGALREEEALLLATWRTPCGSNRQ